ncbi:hypothetical protein GUJ93_ZPchr0003g17834 [Zizania palustris]|uniref:BED-type domain-containing protein n=1 Tax=Zizania palustris TaxID=103762 RepID=A0A8J5V5X8_ZIZPA|nr:hypothetical protein GUJ93_ZPchr0003g17834 [Zizania palustris]
MAASSAYSASLVPHDVDPLSTISATRPNVMHGHQHVIQPRVGFIGLRNSINLINPSPPLLPSPHLPAAGASPPPLPAAGVPPRRQPASPLRPLHSRHPRARSPPPALPTAGPPPHHLPAAPPSSPPSALPINRACAPRRRRSPPPAHHLPTAAASPPPPRSLPDAAGASPPAPSPFPCAPCSVRLPATSPQPPRRSRRLPAGALSLPLRPLLSPPPRHLPATSCHIFLLCSCALNCPALLFVEQLMMVTGSDGDNVAGACAANAGQSNKDKGKGTMTAGRSTMTDTNVEVVCKNGRRVKLKNSIEYIWSHGEKYKVNGFSCYYCPTSIAGGGATRFRQHLAGVSGNVVPCENVPLNEFIESDLETANPSTFIVQELEMDETEVV